MTLGELFALIGDNPAYVLFFFCIIPFAALLAGLLGKGEGHLTPWKYLYSALVYLTCVPGIFSITLNVYLFAFERRSIFATDIYTQILPILSMILTLWLIRRNVAFDYIPGFEKISALITVIAATLILMWIFERTHIIVFSYMPISVALLIFVGLLLLIRYGWKVMFRTGRE